MLSVGGACPYERVTLARCVFLTSDALAGGAELLVPSPDRSLTTAPLGVPGGEAGLAVYTDGHVAGDVWLIEASQMFGLPSAADEPLLVFGVTLALDWDPGERRIDRTQVLAGKLNGDRREILV